MQKQQCPTPSNFKQKNNSHQTSSQTYSNSPGSTFFPSKNQFVDWLKALSTEQRFLAVQVKAPKAVSIIRNTYRKFEQEKISDFPKTQIENQQKGKIFLKQSKTLIEGLVFLSGEYYLDSLGFDFNMVQCPQKIYDLLTYFKDDKYKKMEQLPKQKKMKSYNFEATLNKEEWVLELVKFIKRNLAKLYGITWNPQILQDQKYRKREFSFYWKHLSPQQKLNILYLGCFDTKQLILKLINMDIQINPTIIETEIQDLMKMDKNQFCNRIFKCKLKKCASKIYSYYGLIYKQWKDCVQKSKKKRSKKTNKKKNIKRAQRNKSLGGYSNQTNQTQHKEEKFDINIQQIAMNKLQQDILDCSDWISDGANQFFQRRVLTFQRIQSILQLYQVPVKLYGSCASGIAIQNSDVDIAIEDKILEYYQHLQTTRQKLQTSLEFLYQVFSKTPWIKSVKLISKALVPLLKLTIDTQIPVSQTYFSDDYKKILNRPTKNGGQVCADLTIQTKNQDQSSNHLGIVSTVTINTWLQQIPTLRTLILILKFYLKKRQLNQTYTNGLNTYCLIVMIVAFLEYAKLRQQKSVAIVMSQFLKFYGWQFDQKVQKIDLLHKDVIVKKTEKQKNSANLQIDDPLSRGRIMTRNCYRFDQIKDLMRQISKKCVNRTVNQVQQLCSNLDPKQKFFTNNQLHEIVGEKLRDNYFISQLK